MKSNARPTDQVLVFKTELKPTPRQREQFKSHFGASRFAYNCLLSWTIEEYEKHKADPENYPKPNLSYFSLNKVWNHELRERFAPWYGDNSFQAYASASEALATAYKNFLNRPGKVGYPKWKRSFGKQSFRDTDAILRDCGTQIRVARIGEVRIHERMKSALWLQKMGATLQIATYSMEPGGRIFVSLRYRVPENVYLMFLRGKFQRKGSGFVGVDMGVKTFAVVSDGSVINSQKFFHKHEKKLARAQRVKAIKYAARKKKGADRTRSEARAQQKVVAVHRKIRNRREDFLKKTARKLVMENETVVVETLLVGAMMEEFKRQGKNRMNVGLADNSIGTFFKWLEHYSTRYGTRLIQAERWFASTQICSSCGSKAKTKLTLADREYDCHTCGHKMDRDLNAAVNLEKWGREFLASEAAGYADSLNGSEPALRNGVDQSSTLGSRETATTAKTSQVRALALT